MEKLRWQDYQGFLWEAIKVTLFCLLIVAVFKLSGASYPTILITFNMAVMSCAAVFSPERKTFLQLFSASLVIVLSIVIGGVLGNYFPKLAQLVVLLYAFLAFLLPKTRFYTNLFVTGAVMFLVFTALPFDWQLSRHYALSGAIVIALLLMFHRLLRQVIDNQSVVKKKFVTAKPMITACIALMALLGAWGISRYLAGHTQLSHLYWIGLTVLVVIQGSQNRLIKTSLVRILVNLVGAVLIVWLYRYSRVLT